MAEVIVDVYTQSGAKIGSFRNPKVEMLPAHHYLITGRFYEPDNRLAEKIEFNPQALPYSADISSASQCHHKKLVAVYVMHGRQPVKMMGACPADIELAARKF